MCENKSNDYPHPSFPNRTRRQNRGIYDGNTTENVIVLSICRRAVATRQWRRLARPCPPPSRCQRDTHRHHTAGILPLPPSPHYCRASRSGADADDATLAPCCLARRCRRASAVTATAALLPPPCYRHRRAIATTPYYDSYLHDNQY